MLLEFVVENFKSFKERTCFSMEATADKKHPENLIVTSKGKTRILKTSMIYGANASGKTKLIEAMHMFKQFVVFSHAHLSGDRLTHTPFAFDENCLKKPTFFGIKFIKDGVMYDYSFSYDSNRIVSESLLYYPNGRKAIVFQRDGNDFSFTTDKRTQSLIEGRVKETALYLSVSAQFNYDVTRAAAEWITNEFMVFIGANPGWSMGILLNRMEAEPHFKERVIKAFSIADFGIVGIRDKNRKKDVKVKDMRIPVPTISLEVQDIWIKHSITDEHGRKKDIELPISFESSGTIRFISIIGPMIDALSDGKTIVADEIDVNFHTELCKWILGLFQDPIENPHNAQLIFNTHDLELQDLENVRRDQIWFVEKEWNTGASTLSSLSEFRERNDRDVRKAYLSGRYGARPFISPERLMR